MKKLFALLSLTAFLAVNVNAQSAQTTDQAAAKEAPAVKAEGKSASCCAKINKACCKNNKGAKACTAEQKAACAKAGASEASDSHKDSHAKAGCSHDHSKAEETKETKETKAGTR